MEDEGIRNGDTVVCRRQDSAAPGDRVVALVGGQDATLKKFYPEEGGKVRLQPANHGMSPILLDAREVRIQGVVVAVVPRGA